MNIKEYMNSALKMVQHATIENVSIYFSTRGLYRAKKTYKFFDYDSVCVIRV